MRLNNIIGLKNYRKDLRKHLTPAEARLWNHLKNKQLGHKFRRQHGIGRYIVDFYCADKKLAVELDGSPHDSEQGYAKDENRTEYLQRLNIKVIRFENKDVIKNLEGVLQEIKKNLG